MDGKTLVMELTNEQGPGRETQVQPPLAVWTQFFAVELDDDDSLPVLTLNNLDDPNQGLEDRPVVRHDHNWTIEIAGAAPPRPAILWMRRAGDARYDYQVLRPGAADYEHASWMLKNLPNPYRQKGRRWLVL